MNTIDGCSIYLNKDGVIVKITKKVTNVDDDHLWINKEKGNVVCGVGRRRFVGDYNWFVIDPNMGVGVHSIVFCTEDDIPDAVKMRKLIGAL